MIISFSYGIAVFFVSVTLHALYLRVFGEKQFMLLGLVFGFLVLIRFNPQHPGLDSPPFFL